MDLQEKMMRQFGNPEGLWGRLAGFIMSHRTSNLERIEWSVSLLGVQPGDTVLEIGFGPGVGIEKLSQRANRGLVFGIDRSSLMVKAATKRNRTAVDQGRVILHTSSVSRLPPFGRKMDRILDINTFQFWDNPIEVLGSLNEILTPGGTIAIAHQPRDLNAVRQLSVEAGETIAASLTKSGFVKVKIHMKEMKPVPTICVVATSPG